MKNAFVMAVGVFATAAGVHGGVILHVQDVTVAPSALDQTVRLDVWLEETDDTQAVVQSYDVPLRLGQNGSLSFAYADDATDGHASSQSHPSLFGQAPFIGGNAAFVRPKGIYLYDYKSHMEGRTEVFDDVAIENGQAEGLFSVDVKIPGNTLLGTYSLDVDTTSPLFSFADRNGTRLQGITVDNGTITVAAVPEPSAIALGLLALPLLGRRRRR